MTILTVLGVVALGLLVGIAITFAKLKKGI